MLLPGHTQLASLPNAALFPNREPVVQSLKYCEQFFKIAVINASAAVILLEQRPEKIQALSGIRTYDLCGAGTVLYQ